MEWVSINICTRDHWLLLFIVMGLIQYTNVYCASSDAKKPGPFYDSDWQCGPTHCLVYFWLPDEIQDKKNDVGEFIHRCMIDCHQREQPCGLWFSDDATGILSGFRELHAIPPRSEEERSTYQASATTLCNLSGIFYKTREKISIKKGHTLTSLKLKRNKETPSKHDKALFRQAVGLEKLGLLSKSERKLYLSLALARALMHNEYHHAIHYLINECDPNADLSNYMYAHIDDPDKDGEWIPGPEISVPSLLYACMLSSHLLECEVATRPLLAETWSPLDEPILTGRVYIGKFHEINMLLEKGANPEVVDNYGMRPIDVLKERFIRLQKKHRNINLTLNDPGLLSRLDPARHAGESA